MVLGHFKTTRTSRLWIFTTPICSQSLHWQSGFVIHGAVNLGNHPREGLDQVHCTRRNSNFGSWTETSIGESKRRKVWRINSIRPSFLGCGCRNFYCNPSNSSEVFRIAPTKSSKSVMDKKEAWKLYLSCRQVHDLINQEPVARNRGESVWMWKRKQGNCDSRTPGVSREVTGGGIEDSHYSRATTRRIIRFRASLAT